MSDNISRIARDRIDDIFDFIDTLDENSPIGVVSRDKQLNYAISFANRSRKPVYLFQENHVEGSYGRWLSSDIKPRNIPYEIVRPSTDMNTADPEDMPYSRGDRVLLSVKETPRLILAGGARPLTETVTVEINSWSPSMGSPAIFAKGEDGKFVAFDYADVLSGKIEAVPVPNL